MSPDLLVEFLNDGFSSHRVDDILPLTYQLPLDLQRGRVIRRDPPDDIVGGLGGVVMPDHLRILVKSRSEKLGGEFLLTGFIDITSVLLPHIGDENDILQCWITAEFAKHIEIPPGNPAKPIVGDSVDIYNPGELGPLLISVGRSVRKVEKRRTTMYAYVVAKNAATVSKTSVSLFEVSSNPGISMRVTAFPSRVNSSASLTSTVRDSEPIPIRRFEPLARLMN